MSRTKRERPRWVSPDIHEVFKLLPNNPPVRGEYVLVDGVRCEVLRCPVEWQGGEWTLPRGVKVRTATKGAGR